MDKNIFKSFFKERKIDVDPNTSGFVFFQAFLITYEFSKILGIGTYL